MNTYLIIGKTLKGNEIEQTVTASNESLALRKYRRKYGRLQRRYEIVKIYVTDNFIDESTDSRSRQIQKPLKNDLEILDIAEAIRNNIATQKEYAELEDTLSPMIISAVNDYWNGQTIATPNEVATELLNDVIQEFTVRYDPSKGHLMPFLKKNIQNRIKKKWSRQTYVNSESRHKKRPREGVIRDIFKEQQHIGDKISEDLDEQREKARKAAKDIHSGEIKLNLQQRKVFYSWILRLGLHKEVLRSKRQRFVFEMIYDEFPKTEEEVANIIGVKQQTIHPTKKRAEANIIKGFSIK